MSDTPSQWQDDKAHYRDHYDADCPLCRFVAIAILNDAQERASLAEELLGESVGEWRIE